MRICDISTGLQHVGIPTNDIAKTIAFYEALGFRIVHRKDNRGEDVAFLKMGDLVLETYQNHKAVGISGAIDHIALNVTDVEEARRIADRLKLDVIEEGQLPFWENGVRYFTVLGPNGEKVEFNQYL
jgi:catechol 2,3-dioxygenase-like lactoylglutathione lyase family enzyme